MNQLKVNLQAVVKILTPLSLTLILNLTKVLLNCKPIAFGCLGVNAVSFRIYSWVWMIGGGCPISLLNKTKQMVHP